MFQLTEPLWTDPGIKSGISCLSESPFIISSDHQKEDVIERNGTFVCFAIFLFLSDKNVEHGICHFVAISILASLFFCLCVFVVVFLHRFVLLRFSLLFPLHHAIATPFLVFT